jgi:hypothetical protein
MGAIKGLFLPSLVHINPVVSIEKIKSKKMDDRHEMMEKDHCYLKSSKLKIQSTWHLT